MNDFCNEKQLEGKTFLALQNFRPEIRELNRKDFQLVESKDFEKKTTPDGITGFTSMDPRTFNSPRSEYIYLDKPPLYVKNTQPLEDIYGESNDVKTGYYNSYKDIKGGSLIYYTDLENDLPYSSPVFEIQALNRPSILKDPMDSTKTYYRRVPIPSEIEKISDYSFDRDQMEFREDLISKQQEIFLRNNYSSYDFFKNLSEE